MSGMYGTELTQLIWNPLISYKTMKAWGYIIHKEEIENPINS